MKLMSHIIKPILNLFLRSVACFSDWIFREERLPPVIVSGSPRGGTTWVAEAIAKCLPTKCLIWEPLHEGNTSLRNSELSKRPFFITDFQNEVQRKFFDELIGGRQLNVHLLRLKKFPENLLYITRRDRALIKFVRGNGIVGFLKRHYALPKPVVVLRHPCAVVASQMKMGSWDNHPHVDDAFFRIYPEVKAKIDYTASLSERLAMTWACDVLAAKANLEDLHIIYYEELVLNGVQVLRSILTEWGYEVSDAELKVILCQSSSTTHEWSIHDDNLSKLGRWDEQLDSDTSAAILERVWSMGVEDYGSGLLPRYLSQGK